MSSASLPAPMRACSAGSRDRRRQCDLNSALDLKDRQAAFGKFQKQMLDEAYVIKVGEVGISRPPAPT